MRDISPFRLSERAKAVGRFAFGDPEASDRDRHRFPPRDKANARNPVHRAGHKHRHVVSGISIHGRVHTGGCHYRRVSRISAIDKMMTSMAAIGTTATLIGLVGRRPCPSPVWPLTN